MARTKKISDEQILEAARVVFAKCGFSSTTSQIAAEAGISEGSIFRRWESKDELLITALGISPPPWIERVTTLADEDSSVEEQLVELGTMFLDFFIENIPKMAAMVGCGLHMRQKIMKSHDAPPVQGVRLLTGYFEQLRKKGRIRVADPEIIARTFIGSIHHYAFAEFGGLNDLMPMPRETYVRGLVDVLIRGIEQINE